MNSMGYLLTAVLLAVGLGAGLSAQAETKDD